MISRINSIVKIKRAYSLISLCFLSIFFCNCSRSTLIKEKERVTLTKCFEELLLVHGGAYTLLGSKPATIEDLIDMSPENYKKLQEYLAAHPEIPTIEVDRHLEEGWEVLKQKPILFSDRFVMTELNCGSYNLLVFLNTELTIRSMKEYYSEFKRASGSDFDPIIEVENLRRGKHDLWRRLFSDYVCTGVLLGYGIENARLFEKLYSERIKGNLQEDYQASENTDPRIKADCYLNEIPFRIPVFVMFDKRESEELLNKYKNERERIKKFYADKNFLDETLSALKK